MIIGTCKDILVVAFTACCVAGAAVFVSMMIEVTKEIIKGE